MRHERVVHAVITAKLSQIVGVVQPVEEQFRIAGEAGVHRIAANMNDLRVRQGQMDQSDVLEIAGKLVDDMADIAWQLAEPAQIFPPKLDERAIRQCISRIILSGRSFRDQVLHSRQLSCAQHRRIAGQNLLDQGCPRTRHADDKDRQAGCIARSALHAFGRESGLKVREETRDNAFVISHLTAPERVCFFQMLERGLNPAQIVVSSRQREMQLRLLFVGKIFARESFHRREARIADAERRNLRERAMIRGPLRRQSHGAFKRRACFRRVTELQQGISGAEIRGGIVGVDRENGSKSPQGVVGAPKDVERIARAGQRRDIRRLSLKHGAERAQRFPILPHIEERVAKVAADRRIAACVLVRLPKMRDGIAKAIFAHRNQSQPMQRARMVREEVADFAIMPRRVGQPVLPVRRHCQFILPLGGGKALGRSHGLVGTCVKSPR